MAYICAGEVPHSMRQSRGYSLGLTIQEERSIREREGSEMGLTYLGDDS